MDPKLTEEEAANVAALVSHFVAHQRIFNRVASSLVTLFTENDQLPDLIHSIKYRVKDPEHLRDKLGRKFAKCKAAGNAFDITTDNLFERVNDLAGVRLLHLHTGQMTQIDKALRDLLDHEMYQIVEGPFARTWDDEYREFFSRIGIKPETSQSLYTSVHYVVQPSQRTKCTAEIQVRTLAEELWGEVAHSVNYPHPTASVACQEQIKVLARVTSSCTRLVDSIYKSREEHVGFSSPKL
jgi:putative GTP pyrophosphokinase